jgi:uncharacterized protein
LDRADLLETIAARVQDKLHDDCSGHDWWHVARVRNLAVRLAEHEGADVYIVELAALMHDVSDYKLNGGDHEEGARIARIWLLELGETNVYAEKVAEIVAGVSFKGAGCNVGMSSIEGMVVQDADRLDAMGAIGIARAFAYGASAGQPMFDPGLAPCFHATPAEYFARNGTTINHFYEKLLLLKERMNTVSARLLAEDRHQILEKFLRDFHAEWKAEA